MKSEESLESSPSVHKQTAYFGAGSAMRMDRVMSTNSNNSDNVVTLEEPYFVQSTHSSRRELDVMKSFGSVSSHGDGVQGPAPHSSGSESLQSLNERIEKFARMADIPGDGPLGRATSRSASPPRISAFGKAPLKAGRSSEAVLERLGVDIQDRISRPDTGSLSFSEQATQMTATLSLQHCRVRAELRKQGSQHGAEARHRSPGPHLSGRAPSPRRVPRPMLSRGRLSQGAVSPRHFNSASEPAQQDWPHHAEASAQASSAPSRQAPRAHEFEEYALAPDDAIAAATTAPPAGSDAAEALPPPPVLLPPHVQAKSRFVHDSALEPICERVHEDRDCGDAHSPPASPLPTSLQKGSPQQRSLLQPSSPPLPEDLQPPRRKSHVVSFKEAISAARDADDTTDAEARCVRPQSRRPTAATASPRAATASEPSKFGVSEDEEPLPSPPLVLPACVPPEAFGAAEPRLSAKKFASELDNATIAPPPPPPPKAAVDAQRIESVKAVSVECAHVSATADQPPRSQPAPDCAEDRSRPETVGEAKAQVDQPPGSQPAPDCAEDRSRPETVAEAKVHVDQPPGSQPTPYCAEDRSRPVTVGEAKVQIDRFTETATNAISSFCKQLAEHYEQQLLQLRHELKQQADRQLPEM
eukprot:TRINITY_DN5317_c0_g1_i1.p1 TRINITY_DN5317_c0_g1~~TRINITY_DN5317_c0_g1_i1.p1  ORF type:complete len:642 (+),score=107.15 TRINITY_DN5317_c0_g1_i1:226-2151(+)